MMDILPFKHRPLPAGNHFRILHVRRSANDGTPVCTFETISLDSPSHQYIAISYTWGDPTPVRQVASSDGQPLTLSRILSDLFDAMSNRHDTFTIYVDALCINQSDLVEKANQVRIMGKVYSNAQMVMVWLGVADDHSARAFQYMKKRTLQNQLSTTNTWSNPIIKTLLPENISTKTQDVVDALMALLTRRWFQRVWVIQETILGGNVHVACGDDIIDFDTFKSNMLLLWDCPETVDYLDVRHPSYLGFRCATRIFALQEEFGKSGRIPLEPLFEAIFYYSATDSRDFIFAIQELAHCANLLPGPDYSFSTEKVFTETAENILCRGSSLDLLSMCGLGPRQQASSFIEYIGQPSNTVDVELPSWVPDFRLSAYDEPIWGANRGGWRAGGTFRNSPSRSPGGLHVDAVILDRVAQVGEEIDSMSFDRLHNSLQCTLNVAQGAESHSAHQSPDLVWKTLVQDFDMDEEPAPPELGIEFKALLRALDSNQPWEEVKKNEMYRIIRVRADSWKAFSTKEGYFGMTWSLVEEGDALCLLPGCRHPLIIRPIDEISRGEAEWGRGVLVGWCYVHGIMHGEAVTDRSDFARIVLE
ncbi:heterokaryon incompatibility protein-domain-containing protein [Clohesyomyces aquaticus]|uniref:Heterokaryon incompatibility protein-domain-containing protein n=1 Tax=Clohesyomyces aquaticus TaxID=1231657 RepID=A0A1Y1ZJ19_9PLEO|nr:heterokaryon incompatibility protein-domain-containing protein [Clohesyomyces aquaticus]